jgi:hypothetical protein
MCSSKSFGANCMRGLHVCACMRRCETSLTIHCLCVGVKIDGAEPGHIITGSAMSATHPSIIATFVATVMDLGAKIYGAVLPRRYGPRR